MSRGTARAAVLLLCAALPLAARAETAYVIDKLLVGVHEDKQPNSPIMKLIPTGTALEVLERDTEFARVRTPDGTVGWVDATYLMADEPASVRLEALQKQQAQTEAALAQARQTRAQTQGTLDQTRAALDQARDEQKRTRAALEQAQAEIRKLQSDRRDLQPVGAGPTPPAAPAAGTTTASPAPAPPRANGSNTVSVNSDTLREMQRLAEENLRLKENLTRLAQTPAPVSAGPARAPTPRPLPAAGGPREPAHRLLGIYRVPQLLPWQWTLIASLVLLAFSLGAYAVDWTVRRRHGGFRV